MKEKKITSYRLEKMGFSRATYYSIQKGNSVSTNTINQLCKLLQCSVSEVIEFVDDKQMEATYQKSQPQELVYAPFFDETDDEVTRKDCHEMGL